jgi:hypothetical protein
MQCIIVKQFISEILYTVTIAMSLNQHNVACKNNGQTIVILWFIYQLVRHAHMRNNIFIY